MLGNPADSDVVPHPTQTQSHGQMPEDTNNSFRVQIHPPLRIKMEGGGKDTSIYLGEKICVSICTQTLRLDSCDGRKPGFIVTYIPLFVQTH